MADGQAGAPKGHQRKLRNYLLDRSFQLKYAGFLFGVAAMLSAGLGYLLWTTNSALIDQSREVVSQGQQAVKLGREVAAESKKVSAVVEMNIASAYADDPELLAEFKADANKKGGALSEQQQRLEQQALALEKQSVQLEKRQKTLLSTLFGMLALLAIGIGLAGIVVTHKIAGPIYKMTRQIKDMSDGTWEVPYALRKGDELVSFFGAFRDMVLSLRELREKELVLLDEAIADVDGDTDKLDALRVEMHKVIDC